MECPMPTINTNDANKIKKILEEVQSIAIIGLSPNEMKESNIVGRYLQSVGYKIIPIYPKEDFILGEKVYRSLGEVDEKVDMVDMFRKPAIADSLLEEVLKRDDISVFWLQLGIVNNEACEKAKKAGLKVVQNRCSKIEHQRLMK